MGKLGRRLPSWQEDGHGIIHLREMNEALKPKWLRRFDKEEDTMWKIVIEMKYGVDNIGWWSNKSSYAHGVGYWKSIMSGSRQFRFIVQFKVKMGQRY